jgi:hypothetical protein
MKPLVTYGRCGCPYLTPIDGLGDIISCISGEKKLIDTREGERKRKCREGA